MNSGSKLLLTQANGGGSVGNTGATFHFSVDGDSTIDTSITLVGVQVANVLNYTPSATTLGNGYLALSSTNV